MRTLHAIWQDARYGMRQVRRAPLFSSIIVVTLALGIGGTTAILGVVNTVYFATLPIAAPARVLRLYDSSAGTSGDRRLFGMHSQNVAEVLRRDDVFAGTAAMFGEELTATGGSAPERVTVVSRTRGWRDTLGIAPVLGRDFTSDEELRGRASGVALVSDALWNRRFGGATPGTAVLHLDGRPFVVVGVMPPGFRFPYQADAWIPDVVNQADHARDYAVFARIRDGIDQAHVRAAMDVVSAQLRGRYPDELPGYTIAVTTLRENLVANEANATLALLLIVLFLLLLACTNVATLLLARWSARQREFTVRAALGASRARQLQQALTETMLFALAGGLLGVLLAAWAAPFTGRLIPGNISVQLGLAAPQLDWRVLASTAAIVMATAMISGLMPAFGGGLQPAALQEAGRSAAADSPRTRRLLTAFATAQVALALVLLGGAGAVVENLRALTHRDLGVRTAGLLTMTLTPSRATHAADRDRLTRRIVDAVSSLPAVESAGVTTVNPFGGGTWSAQVIAEGQETGRETDAVGVNHRLITPGLLRAMGTPLLRGRDIEWQDAAGRAPVAIVSARMAARLWHGEDAVGKRLRAARAGSAWITVVGIAADVADAGDPGDPNLTWYLPYGQYAASPAAEDLHLMVRAPATVLPAVRAAIARIDAALPVYDVTTMDAYYARTLDRERLAAVVTAGFVVFGTLLAALGVYGVMAFAVARRTPEFALRVALGAAPRAIFAVVAASSIRVLVVASVIGAVGTVVLRRALLSVLPHADGISPASVAIALGVLLVVVAGASWLPARRAARIDPMEVMRT